MKSIKEIKEEYKQILINSIRNNYIKLQEIKHKGFYRDMSPETNKDLQNEEGRFSWSKIIKTKIKDEQAKYEKSKFLNVDLLDIEDSPKEKKTELEQPFYRPEGLDFISTTKNIISQDILNEYPLKKIAEKIQHSIDAIQQSDKRASECKIISFEKVISLVEKKVDLLTKHSAYATSCQNILETHTLLYRYSDSEEEKQFCVRELLKLKDELQNHHIIINIEIDNTKTFTSQFVNSEYSLTEEEAAWWINYKKKNFEIAKEEIRLEKEIKGIGDVEDFKVWYKKHSTLVFEYPISNNYIHQYKIFKIIMTESNPLEFLKSVLEIHHFGRLISEKTTIEDAFNNSIIRQVLREVDLENLDFYRNKVINKSIVNDIINDVVEQVENFNLHQEEAQVMGGIEE